MPRASSVSQSEMGALPSPPAGSSTLRCAYLLTCPYPPMEEQLGGQDRESSLLLPEPGLLIYLLALSQMN